MKIKKLHNFLIKIFKNQGLNQKDSLICFELEFNGNKSAGYGFIPKARNFVNFSLRTISCSDNCISVYLDKFLKAVKIQTLIELGNVKKNDFLLQVIKKYLYLQAV